MAEPRHDDLVSELRALADHLELPRTPDVRASVRARLTTDRAPSRRPARWSVAARRGLAGLRGRSRRWRAAAAAVVVAAVLTVLPSGRAAVADAVTGLLRFAGVEFRQGPPSAPPSAAPLPSTRSLTLDEARRRATFPIRLPELLGTPQTVELSDPTPAGAPRVVSLGYRDGTVRLDEFDGQPEPMFMKTAEEASWTTVNGTTALWFAKPHDLEYLDRQGTPRTETARLAGPTLIWSDGSVTYRLEGPFGQDEAVRIAASMR